MMYLCTESDCIIDLPTSFYPCTPTEEKACPMLKTIRALIVHPPKFLISLTLSHPPLSIAHTFCHFFT